jgi:hypothetical protein
MQPPGAWVVVRLVASPGDADPAAADPVDIAPPVLSGPAAPVISPGLPAARAPAADPVANGLVFRSAPPDAVGCGAVCICGVTAGVATGFSLIGIAPPPTALIPDTPSTASHSCIP